MATETEPPWTTADIDGYLANARSYRSLLSVKAEKLGHAATWTAPGGIVLNALPGDWSVSDDETTWTVAAHIFDETYERVSHDRYRKTATVVARRLEEHVVIATIEGLVQAHEGDWLVRNPGGDAWPVSAEEFDRRYEPVCDERRIP
ncbi:hypothetical protein [Microbacterium oxydans]|uniref:hypothetical protein n=1 Tax=Microbacterium oxydans TaxID=82380 RepID=UPI0024AE442A|nr:hypothetical protein [Microbacterium oxydans]